MKRLLFTLIVCVSVYGFSSAQNYDSVSGATQKEGAKMMNLEQFTEALSLDKKLVISTVNEDGSPNAAVYGSFVPIDGNVFAVNSISDSKTTKINLMRSGKAILIMMLDAKTTDGFDGAKVLLHYIDDQNQIGAYRKKMEKSSEKTTFFSVEKFLVYR